MCFFYMLEPIPLLVTEAFSMNGDLNVSLNVNDLMWAFVFIFIVQNCDFFTILGNFILMILFRFTFHDGAE